LGAVAGDGGVGALSGLAFSATPMLVSAILKLPTLRCRRRPTLVAEPIFGTATL
jgi:hypothetical protein